jgi:hypothetical protein
MTTTKISVITDLGLAKSRMFLALLAGIEAAERLALPRFGRSASANFLDMAKSFRLTRDIALVNQEWGVKRN